jgi:2-oxoglutarate ferredoxin oxidoreductase subunit alpha
MTESINMAFMMELPMLIVLVQRLGPSTGTATAGAQDDLLFLHGIISGGYPIPVFCIGDTEDCWRLPPLALQTSLDLRSPVILLTSKEMVMTERSVDLGNLHEIKPIRRQFYDAAAPYSPYAANNTGVPLFLPLGDGRHQVRMTASTHDQQGILQHSTEDALANTRRLPKKVKANTPTLYYLDEMERAQTLIITYGITSGAAKAAMLTLREEGEAVSLLVARTLLPVADAYYDILGRYPHIVFAEENVQGQFASILFGERLPAGVKVVGDIGRMVRPDEISEAVRR